MLAVADIAIEELNLRNNSDTISRILCNRDNPDPFWCGATFRWVGLSDLEDQPVMFAFRPADERIRGSSYQFITVEECISALSSRLTVTEQEFIDALQGLL